ncbi:MAG: hypothetical protein BWY15_00708 [Firmicutes bacterium ADurb.Bin193]|nr:MAG: hypothetical protein BWY15_00708 [Firmicutes bacterium ADurb.Bin193]
MSDKNKANKGEEDVCGFVDELMQMRLLRRP